MRLTKDCLIEKVGKDDSLGHGIRVWTKGGELLGRFQRAGMKIEGEAKPNRSVIGYHANDEIVLFDDREDMDNDWLHFRRQMMRNHLVYIPNHHHTKAKSKVIGALSAAFNIWLPIIASVLWMVLPWLFWRAGKAFELSDALAVSFMALVLIQLTTNLRKGRI